MDELRRQCRKEVMFSHFFHYDMAQILLKSSRYAVVFREQQILMVSGAFFNRLQRGIQSLQIVQGTA